MEKTANNPSAIRVLLAVKPWRELPLWALVLLGSAFVAITVIFIIVFVQTRMQQWGVLLVIPTIIVSLTGGIIVGLLGTFCIAVTPIIITLLVPAGSTAELGMAFMGIATLIYLLFSAVLGYVGALVISFRHTLQENRTLKGILPICAHCKRVRDDRGYWQQVEDYISSHSELEFSHGFCDDCMKELYPELVERRSEE